MGALCDLSRLPDAADPAMTPGAPAKPPARAGSLARQTAQALLLPVLALCVGALGGHLVGTFASVPLAGGPGVDGDLWSVAGGLTALGGVCWRDLAPRWLHRGGRDTGLPK